MVGGAGIHTQQALLTLSLELFCTTGAVGDVNQKQIKKLVASNDLKKKKMYFRTGMSFQITQYCSF